jgi:predicted GNAT family N-acyltransferase
MSVILKKLEAANKDQISRFKLADEADRPLVNFLRRTALKSSKANLTQTYVIKNDGQPNVIAYITLMCAEVALAKTYQIPDKAGADHYDFQPAIRIARLAVADTERGNGYGRTLVELAIDIALYQIQPVAGCRFLILDAKKKSIIFYENLGFRLLDTAANRTAETPLMFMDLQNLN